MSKKIKEEIFKRDLGKRVFILDNANDETKKLVLENSAALFHPSKREGYGLAIIEAAALGVPAILIRSDDNKSTELGINPSLVAESANVSQLAALVLKAQKDQLKLSEECRRWIREKGPKMTSSASISEISTFIRNNAKGT